MKGEMIMKHYVVVLDWATEDDEAVAILGVTHTYEEAKAIFDKQRIEEMEIQNAIKL